MDRKYNVMFVKAGSGSPQDNQRIAQSLASASKQPFEKILNKINAAPFVYRSNLSQPKAKAIATALQRLGATVDIQPMEAAAPAPSPPEPAPQPAQQMPPPQPAPPPAPQPGLPPEKDSGEFDFKFDVPGMETPAQEAPQAAGAPGQQDFSLGGQGGDSEPPIFGGIAEDPMESGASDGQSGGVGGFGVEAVVASTEQEADLGVERNVDYAVDQIGSTTKTAPEPVSGEGLEDLVVCPRCSFEQPPSPECSACGVIMEKVAPAAPTEGAPQAATPVKRKAKAKKMSGARMLVFLIPAVIVILAGCYFLGLFNPLLVSIKTKTDPVLKAYKAKLSRTQSGMLLIKVEDPAKAEALENNLLSLGPKVTSDLARLQSLDSVEDFDALRGQSESQLNEYRGLEVFKLRDRAREIASMAFPVDEVGWSLKDRVVQTTRDADKLKDTTNLVLVDPDVIDEWLATFRDDANARETRLQKEAWVAKVNSDINESFEDSDLGPRWEWIRSQAQGFKVRRGRAQWTTNGSDLIGETNTANLLSIEEPTKDYELEVTVDIINGRSDARAGVIIFKDDDNFIEYMVRPGRSGGIAQMGLEQTDGEYSTPIAEPRRTPLTIRIRKKGIIYEWLLRDPRTGRWSVVDRYSPPWAKEKVKRIALAAFGPEGATFGFDRFKLTVIH
ncbi:hypothetical protein ACFLU6_01265 [Acidobacteriota bacterium]